MDPIENAVVSADAIRSGGNGGGGGVAILNYYTCNVDTLWALGLVIILMVGTLLLLKIIVWDSIYRHHGICYPMGAILGGGASRCSNTDYVPLATDIRRQPRLPTESFVPKRDSYRAAYPELVPTVVNYVEQTGSKLARTLKTTVAKIFYSFTEGWRWGDRHILELHDQVGHLRGMVYDDYVRPVVQKYMRT
jgi:hypothetical protein